MSAIGAGIGSVPLASSLAGGLRGDARANEAGGEATVRNATAGREAAAARLIGDIAGSGESADRDADGRMAEGDVDESPLPPPGQPDELRRSPVPAADPFGERGAALDLEA